MNPQEPHDPTGPGPRSGRLPAPVPTSPWRRALSSLTEFRAFGPTTVLRRLALLEPKKRKRRVPWVLVAAVIGVVAALMMDVSVREWTLGRARPLWARARSLVARKPVAAAPAESASAAPPPVESAVAFSVTSAAPAASTAEPVPSASASAEPAPSAAPSATAKRPGGKRKK